MFDVESFISQYVTGRSGSLFQTDVESNHDLIAERVSGKSLCVIGGAGSIGSQFIKAILPFHPSKLVVVDLNENGLAELSRDLRSTDGLFIPEDYRTYTIDFAGRIFENIFRKENGFDIVANFSAHKHVRSEKDKYSVEALIENNLLKARRLMDLLSTCPPERFFCVSTDKAANPVNVMGASKRVLEDLIMSYGDRFTVTTARFANVAFSNGSLLDGFLNRLSKKQPLAAPNDIKRYFVSPQESGQICLMACVLGNSGEVFFPKLGQESMMSFSDICDRFLEANGLDKIEFDSDDDARKYAAEILPSGESGGYPVVYSRSDTTGEKPYEEFYTDGEEIEMDRYASLGVITGSDRKSKEEVGALMDGLSELFADDSFTKQDVVGCLERYLPSFTHEEKGLNLDQKM